MLVAPGRSVTLAILVAAGFAGDAWRWLGPPSLASHVRLASDARSAPPIVTLEGAPPERRWMSVHGEQRPSLVVTVPARFRFEATVPPEGRLSFGVVVRPVEAVVRLQVAVVSEGATRREVYDEPWRDQRPWLDRTVDLAAHEGETVGIEFALEGGPATVALGSPEVVGATGDDRPNVLVYVVDCLRADHVGAYGYPRATTPSIDRVAAEGIVFEKVYSCAAWTKPAVGCLFTSTYPWRHGARTLDGSLAPDVRTVAEAFQAAGYATQAWVANPVVDHTHFGFGRGFDRFMALAQRWTGRNVNEAGARADAALLNGSLRWVEDNPRRPFFLYLHSLDLHAPYRPRPPFDTQLVREGTAGIERERDLYDNELAYNDREIGRLLDGLRRLDVYDRTLVVITADHGEEFMEHGVARHGRSLYDDALHVPFIVKLPRGLLAGRRVGAVASSLDLSPTLLDYAGLAPPASFRGVSLRSYLSGARAPARPLFAEQLGPGQAVYALRDGRWKYVRHLLPDPREMLFDLRADAGEDTNLLPGQVPPAGMGDGLAAFIHQGLDGYHVLFDAGPRGPRRFRAEAVGGFKDVIRLVARTGDRLEFTPGAATIDYTIAPGGPSRHLVLRTARAAQPATLWIGSEDRAVRGREITVGAVEHHPTAVPFTVDPIAAEVPTYVAGEAVAKHSARAWVWYLAPRTQPVDIEKALADRLRTLGYVQ